ncbi:MAG: mandelate racemase/muconate lactonizing enzyme family protein [Bacteroidales bacterium]|nr:mandelate racemase/muconate lactonizing enzyme family protein [Bacteroidales bacterium]
MEGLTRRKFIKSGMMATGAAMVASPLDLLPSACSSFNTRKITISRVGSDFEREPMIRPMGFKGGYLTELWQTAAYLESTSGLHSIGLCTQSILWSDANVFSSNSESGGNALMYAMTERALQIIKGESFSSPVELLESIYPLIYEYGKKITSNETLRKTFALNSLVGVDNAAWILYARENGITSFDDLIPKVFKPALGHRHDKVAGVPLFAYSVPVEEIREAAEQGYFFMKIKIGQPGTQEEMLTKDKARLTEIHKAIGNIRTPYTSDGRIPYYFDANGRYESKDALLRLLDHAKSIGAFDQITLIEEPFAEEIEIDVSDIPVRLASDETAHTGEDAVKRIEMGYRAIALKAIAKTLSMTMKIAQAAYDRSIPCFCADLTVNPILLEWNKNVAARLSSFPGIGNLGLLESNGHQNYANWDKMLNYHPCRDAGWVQVRKGIYELDHDFYRRAGGIFEPVPHYEAMFTSV